MFLLFRLLAFIFLILKPANASCGENQRTYSNVEMDNVYGLWFGVGYAQHSPDLTNRPNVIGCVTLYISDVTYEDRQDWLGLDNPYRRRNWTNPQWLSPHNNPWSGVPMSGSWLDYQYGMRRMKRSPAHQERTKRGASMDRIPPGGRSKRGASYYGDRRLRVVWDEDGQTEEQVYGYWSGVRGLWKLEQWRPGEREMLDRGMNMYYPHDEPKRPETIHVLKSTPYLLVLHHCSEGGGGRSFSLILKREPRRLTLDDQYEFRRSFFNYELPNVFRFTTVCAGCTGTASKLLMLLAVVLYYCF
ncbi:uncharacterized protein LOC105382463 [Plutella xylostella]|uniref:uncharacterized protein LOC105382463 n=1 Tax=Plutella xylostella TaxID=51655 RepID=UPI0020325210|nr:uncharacterized protein LOC105382463 [Plutella xylostella]